MATARFLLKTLLVLIARHCFFAAAHLHRGHGEGRRRRADARPRANVDCTPEHLRQFVIMGAALSSALTDKSRPDRGLAQYRRRRNQGNDIVKEAAELIRD